MKNPFALAVVGAAVLFGAIGAPIGNFDDPELRQAVIRELRAEYTRKMLPQLKAAVNELDEARAEELAEGFQAFTPKIVSFRANRSLLRRSGKPDVVVQVEYTLPGDPVAKSKYYQCRYSLIGGWHLQRESSKLLYYLNLL